MESVVIFFDLLALNVSAISSNRLTALFSFEVKGVLVIECSSAMVPNVWKIVGMVRFLLDPKVKRKCFEIFVVVNTLNR